MAKLSLDVDAQAESAPATDTAGTTDATRTIQSVDRALGLLETLADKPDGMVLRDIAEQAGLNASTCHHLLATLAKHRFVVRSSRKRAYVLGPRIAELASHHARTFDLVELAMPELRLLNETTKESVHLAVLQGCNLTTVAHLESKLPIRVGSDAVAKANAAHATATGKAILAWLPEPEIARVIAATGLRRHTDRTLQTITDLMEELRLTRRRGFSIDNEEFQSGVYCVAAAIRGQSGAVLGSVGCSMPRMRADGEHLRIASDAVRACAADLSRQLGGFADPAAPTTD